ncbi:hypothetical protein Y032_0048g1625 [Ancylostoma ceylanicum]|uniref:Uncharacterized protein n=1 Tax=Ancylostoma ceylanicum TaxID=53326 RepID=A0A016UC01_9BILA|nr:hypothetical protein Y032_0048g1625 [Ancylostoma ceylanicum]
MSFSFTLVIGRKLYDVVDAGVDVAFEFLHCMKQQTNWSTIRELSWTTLAHPYRCCFAPLPPLRCSFLRNDLAEELRRPV